MTEGTSQGLFVVVAIVIFGIFIGLTYTLFGSEGLSNDLKGIFENATAQTTINTDYSKYYVEKITFISNEDDFEFDKSTGTLTKYIGKTGDVVIPFEIDGVKVKVVGDSAFEYSEIKKVSIPNTVTKIGKYSFRGNQITKLKLPISVKTLDIWSFADNDLAFIDLGELETLAGSALSWNDLTELTLPSSLKVIGNGAIRGNQLKQIIIPETVNVLGENQFSYFSLLKDIQVPLKFKADFESNRNNLIKRYENSDTQMNITEYYDISEITFY